MAAFSQPEAIECPVENALGVIHFSVSNEVNTVSWHTASVEGATGSDLLMRL